MINPTSLLSLVASLSLFSLSAVAEATNVSIQGGFQKMQVDVDESLVLPYKVKVSDPVCAKVDGTHSNLKIDASACVGLLVKLSVSPDFDLRLLGDKGDVVITGLEEHIGAYKTVQVFTSQAQTVYGFDGLSYSDDHAKALYKGDGERLFKLAVPNGRISIR